MSILQQFLVAAPVLQDLLVDKLGVPLAGGIVTCYEDESRTFLKNWYYQVQSGGSYNYITLPNPLTLSAAGTIEDANGNDTIPFFYTVSEIDNATREVYYITVDNAQGQRQFTRENFPFLPPAEVNPVNQVATNQNYVINNNFWRNLGSVTTSAMPATTYPVMIAPSNHDGFSMPDINFYKNNNSGIDTITCTKFTQGPAVLTGDPQPEFYINHMCTSMGSSETQKMYQFPIQLHILNLQSQLATFTIQAQGVSGGNDLSIYLYQFTGTGSSPPMPRLLQTIQLNANWQKYIFNFSFDTASGLSLNGAPDDAWYIQIGMPLNQLCNINFAVPSVYLGQDVAPTTSFQTYDQTDSIINSPRTGSIKITMNIFNDDSINFGWVPLDDGTIGTVASAATTRANSDTWPLYNVLWNSVSDTYAPVSGGRGVSAFADFNANKTIGLTKQLGRVIASIGAPSSGDTTHTTWLLGQTTGNEQYTLVADDLPAHVHPAIPGHNFIVDGTGGEFTFNPAGVSTIAANTGNNVTANNPVNIQDPVVYYKVLMKL